MRISGTEPSSVILSQTKLFLKLKSDTQKCQNKLKPIIKIWSKARAGKCYLSSLAAFAFSSKIAGKKLSNVKK